MKSHKRLIMLAGLCLLLAFTLVPATAQSETGGIYFIGQHHVTDWPTWWGVYNEVQTIRDQFGNPADGNEVYRASPFRNYILALEPYPDADSAAGFASSLDLADAMARATADSPVRIYINELVESETPGEGGTTLVIELFVTDFDGWNAAFASMGSVMGESGATGHRTFRDVNYANHVTVFLDFDTLESAQAFWESGVISAAHDLYVAPPIVLLMQRVIE